MRWILSGLLFVQGPSVPDFSKTKAPVLCFYTTEEGPIIYEGMKGSKVEGWTECQPLPARVAFRAGDGFKVATVELRLEEEKVKP